MRREQRLIREKLETLGVARHVSAVKEPMPILDNAKHEAFAHAIAKGTPQREAYKAAGYVTKNDATADACASRLLSAGKIQARVAELRQAISTHTVEKTSVSKAWVIAKLVENVERAMQAVPVLDRQGNPTGAFTYQGNVANRALELIGKEYGMFIDRKEIGGAGAFDHLDDDELNKIIEALAEEVQEIEQALLPPPKPKERNRAGKD